MDKIRIGRQVLTSDLVIVLLDKVNELVQEFNTLAGKEETLPEGACDNCYNVIGTGICKKCGKAHGR